MGNIRKLRESGRLDFGVDTGDDEDRKQAAEIRDVVKTEMKQIFDVYISRNDDNDDDDDDDD